MTSTEQAVSALGVLGIQPESPFSIDAVLADGLTNTTWRVTYKNERYVLRKVKPYADIVGLSFSEELDVVKKAAAADIAPGVVRVSVPERVLLSRYVDGRTWSIDDMRDQRQLDRLAAVLRRVHRLDVDVRPLDLPGVFERYAKNSVDPQAPAWRKAALDGLGEVSLRKPVVCHNDLTAANVLDGDQLCLIDWEYAALGDPLFDLAVVVSHHDLGASSRDFFLQAYLGQSDERASFDLKVWCEIYHYLRLLWESAAKP